jgi:hypothetical protein
MLAYGLNCNGFVIFYDIAIGLMKKLSGFGFSCCASLLVHFIDRRLWCYLPANIQPLLFFGKIFL